MTVGRAPEEVCRFSTLLTVGVAIAIAASDATTAVIFILERARNSNRGK